MIIAKGSKVRNVKTGVVGVLKADVIVDSPESFLADDGSVLEVVYVEKAVTMLNDRQRAAVVEKVQAAMTAVKMHYYALQRIEDSMNALAGAIQRGDIQSAKMAQSQIKGYRDKASAASSDYFMEIGTFTSWDLSNVGKE